MVTLKLTNQQAAAVRSVLNISGIDCEHINARSVENEAAALVGMKVEDMERCIQEVWEALKMEVSTEVAA